MNVYLDIGHIHPSSTISTKVLSAFVHDPVSWSTYWYKCEPYKSDEHCAYIIYKLIFFDSVAKDAL